MDHKVFLCVYRVNFPHFEIYPLFCVNFFYWGVIFPSIRINLSCVNFKYLNKHALISYNKVYVVPQGMEINNVLCNGTTYLA